MGTKKKVKKKVLIVRNHLIDGTKVHLQIIMKIMGREAFLIELIEEMKPGFLFSMLWFPDFGKYLKNF